MPTAERGPPRHPAGTGQANNRYSSPPSRGTPGGRSTYQGDMAGRRARDRDGARSLHVRGYDIQGTCDRDLRVVFEKFGPVLDVYLPKDFFTKNHRGFAYVQFRDEAHAEEARVKLDRTDLFGDGREVNIMWAAGDRKTPVDMRRLDIVRDNPHARREREFERRRGSPRGRGGPPRPLKRFRSRSPARYRRSPGRSRSRSRSPRRDRRRRSPPRDRSRSPRGRRDRSPPPGHRRRSRSPPRRRPSWSPRGRPRSRSPRRPRYGRPGSRSPPRGPGQRRSSRSPGGPHRSSRSPGGPRRMSKSPGGPRRNSRSPRRDEPPHMRRRRNSRSRSRSPPMRPKGEAIIPSSRPSDAVHGVSGVNGFANGGNGQPNGNARSPPGRRMGPPGPGATGSMPALRSVPHSTPPHNAQ